MKKVPTWVTMHVEVMFLLLFLPILCIIKLDNCTVLMTSSNLLSIINVTKSNLDIKHVHELYTPFLCHCLCVCEQALFCLCLFCICGNVCVHLQNITGWFDSRRLIFLTAVNVKETRLWLVLAPHTL